MLSPAPTPQSNPSRASINREFDKTTALKGTYRSGVGREMCELLAQAVRPALFVLPERDQNPISGSEMQIPRRRRRFGGINQSQNRCHSGLKLASKQQQSPFV